MPVPKRLEAQEELGGSSGYVVDIAGPCVAGEDVMHLWLLGRDPETTPTARMGLLV